MSFLSRVKQLFGGDKPLEEDSPVQSPEIAAELQQPAVPDTAQAVHQQAGSTRGELADFDILEELLIDAGIDVIELLQPDLLGVGRLAREFGGKVCFCCSVDHQRRAISGARDEIFAYARFLRDTLGTFSGGFIAYIEDYACLGMSEQNYQWIREAFHRLNDETPA